MNTVLKKLFEKAGISLVDFKLEFGRDEKGKLLLGDEISPDGCRLWDLHTHAKMDKDLYRRGLGELVPAYGEVLKRLEAVL